MHGCKNEKDEAGSCNQNTEVNRINQKMNPHWMFPWHARTLTSPHLTSPHLTFSHFISQNKTPSSNQNKPTWPNCKTHHLSGGCSKHITGEKKSTLTSLMAELLHPPRHDIFQPFLRGTVLTHLPAQFVFARNGKCSSQPPGGALSGISFFYPHQEPIDKKNNRNIRL